jgi:hypothetical protein
MVVRRATPQRRNPLGAILGEPGPAVDVPALYRQFERQDRQMLIERDRAEHLSGAVTALQATMGEVVTELDATRLQVNAANPAAGGRIAAVASRCRELLGVLDGLGIEPISPGGGRASSGQPRGPGA